MSYILDALRKSDQQRQRGTAPTLQTAQTTPAFKRQVFWVYGVLGAMLVGTGIVIGWLRPWQLEQPVPVAGPIAAKPLESNPRQSATVAPVLAAPPINGNSNALPAPPADVTQSRVPASSVLTQSAPAPALANTRPRNTSRSAGSAVSKEAAMPASGLPADPAGLAGAAQEYKVLTLSELPPAIRQEIPPMSISVHAYSPRPNDRMVSINDRLLREGGNLPPGLTLEQITPDGMVFSYKGYRFRRGLGGAGAAAESR